MVVMKPMVHIENASKIRKRYKIVYVLWSILCWKDKYRPKTGRKYTRTDRMNRVKNFLLNLYFSKCGDTIWTMSYKTKKQNLECLHFGHFLRFSSVSTKELNDTNSVPQLKLTSHFSYQTIHNLTHKTYLSPLTL
jgi:hypothetical protein